MHLVEFRRPSLPYSLRPFAGGILATSILAASMNAAWAATFRPVLQPKSGTEPGDASEVVFSESVSGDAAEVFKPWLDTVWDGEWLMTTSLKVKDGASVVIGRADEIYAVCADHIVVADGASLTFLGVPTVMGLNGALSLTLKNASLILSARQADPEVPLGGVLTVDGPVLVSGTSRVLLEGLGVEVPGVTPLTPTVVLEWRPEKLTFADGTSRLEIKVGSNSVLLLGAQNPATVAEGIPLKGMLVVGGELTLDPRVSYLVGDLTDMRPGVNFYVGSGGVLVFEGAEILGRTSSGAMLIAPEGTKIQFAPGSVLWVGADADSADMKDAAEKFDFEGAEVYGLEVLTVRGGHEEGHFTQNRDGSIGFVVGKRTFSGDFAGTLENIDLQSASRWLRSYYISAASDDISSGLEQLALVPATAGGAESMLKSTALPVDVLARWLDPARIPEVAPGGDGVVIEFPPVLRRIPVEVTVGTVEGDGKVSGGSICGGESTDITGGFVRFDAVSRAGDWLIGFRFEGRSEEEKPRGCVGAKTERSTLGAQVWAAKPFDLGKVQAAFGWAGTDEKTDIVVGDALVRAKGSESMWTAGVTLLSNPVAGTSAYAGFRAVWLGGGDIDCSTQGETVMKTTTEEKIIGALSAGFTGSAEFAFGSWSSSWLPEAAGLSWSLSGEVRSGTKRTVTSSVTGSPVSADIRADYLDAHAFGAEVGATLRWRTGEVSVTASTRRGDRTQSTSSGARLTWFPFS